MRVRAFTLVELLVVVGIVAVLIAILLPALSKARTASRKSVCASRERGLTHALRLYVSDWDSLIPTAPQSNIPGTILNQWAIALPSYVKLDSMRQCPEASLANQAIFTAGTSAEPWNVPASTGAQAPVSLQTGAYAFNGWLYATRLVPAEVPVYDEDTNTSDADDTILQTLPPLVTDPGRFYRLPILGKESQIPTFADATWCETWPLESDQPPINMVNGPGVSDTLSGVCIFRHAKTVEVAFFDGHAENVPLAQLWTLNWHAKWQTPRFLPVIR